MSPAIPFSVAARRLCAAALVAAGAPALAQMSQNTVTPPGGFASACAAGISSDNQMPYGARLANHWSFPGWAGRWRCTESPFQGADGAGLADAAYSENNVANSSFAAASLGRVELVANNLSPGNHQFAQGAANGGFGDRSTITLDGHAGAAVWLFVVDIAGGLSTTRGAAAFGATAYRNGQVLARNVSGFDPGGSDLFSTDAQLVRWGVASGGVTERTVDDRVTFAMPVTLGQAFNWGIYASAYAGQRAMATGQTAPTYAALDFAGPGQGLSFAGSLGLLVGGQLYEQFDIASLSGIDWRLPIGAPVPEPAGWALLLAGVAALRLWRGRHGDGA